MNDKRKNLMTVLSFLTIVFAFFAWWSVRAAVVVPDSSTWLVPMVLFSFYIIMICLDIMIFRSVLLLETLLIGSMSLSLLFAFSFLQFGAVLLSGYLVFLSSRRIREDMDFNLRISTWKSLQSGKSYLLMAMALLIAMQYFFVISNFDGEKKVPHLDVSFITKKIAIPFLSSVNPQFKSLEDETLTVDQFILKSQEDAIQNAQLDAENERMIDAQIPIGLPQAQRDAIKKQALDDFSGAASQLSQKNGELVLVAGRRQLSDLVGASLLGSEKISDVFTGLVSNKINNYFNPKVEGENKKSSVFSMILATVLLLTIYPVGLLMSLVWFLSAKLIMAALIKFKFLEVKIITVSKESLE